MTISDLYHELTGLRQDVTTALSQMERTNERAAGAEQRVSDHESRIRTLENAVPSSLEMRIMSLEKFRWQIAGGIFAIQALGVLVEWLLWSKK